MTLVHFSSLVHVQLAIITAVGFAHLALSIGAQYEIVNKTSTFHTNFFEKQNSESFHFNLYIQMYNRHG